MSQLQFLKKLAVESLPCPILHQLRRMLVDCAGGSAVALAISLSGLTGVAGLATETASWYAEKRAMQGAADTAASTAAAALAGGSHSTTTLSSEAKSVAASYSFVDGSNSTTVTVNYPPRSGDYQSSPAVEVLISRPQPALFSGLFLEHGPTISVRAVALANTSLTGQACVVALDSYNETSMTTSGSTALSFPAARFTSTRRRRAR